MPNLDALAASSTFALLVAAVKATALLALAAAAASLLRRHSAALRHLLWTVALGSTIALLILQRALPAWRVVRVPAVAHGIALPSRPDAGPSLLENANWRSHSVAGESPSKAMSHRSINDALARKATPTGASSGAVEPSFRAAPPFRWTTFFLAGWLIGAAIVGWRYAVSRIALVRLARSSTMQPDSGVLESLRRQMGIKRPIRLRQSDVADLPLTWGTFHPQILLPATAVEWSAERRRHVLEHELAHVRRFDATTQIVAQIATVLFWFHPLVWFAAAQLRRERERACDDVVLARGTAASDYASDLLALVTGYRGAEPCTAALAFARAPHFESRLLALLDRDADRRVPTRRGVSLVLVLSSLCVVPVAALESVPARAAQRLEQAVALPSQSPLDRVEPRIASSATVVRVANHSAPITPSVAPSLAPSPDDRATPHPSSAHSLDIFDTCPRRIPHHDSDSETNDAGITRWTASASNEACSFGLDAEGDIHFGSDATTIESIAPGSRVTMIATIRGTVTQLDVRGPAVLGGAPTYELTRDGRPTELSSDGIAWIANFLIAVDRTTAFAINGRFPELVQAGGAEFVLDEVDRMHSEYAQSQYLERLIRTTALDPDELRHVGRLVVAMPGTHAAGDAIVAVASRYPLTDSSTRALFLSAALSLTAQYERVRAILAIVNSAPANDAEKAAIMSSLRGMNDSERRRIVRAITPMIQ